MPPVRKKPWPIRAGATTPAAPDTHNPPHNPQYAFALDEPVTPPVAPAATAIRRLWFCAYLPQLPLEASGPANEARVVVEEQQGIHRVLLASPQALEAGVQPGQSANAALALLPKLKIEERSMLREQQALEALANWLEQFTSVVCIADRDVLLIEIAGSLRLYGARPSNRPTATARPSRKNRRRSHPSRLRPSQSRNRLPRPDASRARPPSAPAS